MRDVFYFGDKAMNKHFTAQTRRANEARMTSAKLQFNNEKVRLSKHKEEEQNNNNT